MSRMQEESGKMENEVKKRRVLRGWIESIIEAAIIVVLMFCFCWPVRIGGASMEASLLSGDRVFISRAMVVLHKVERGDIVVCRLEDAGKKQDIIKRVIGIPGDEVAIADGIVYVNGAVAEEAYLHGVVTDGMISVTLAEGEYFVMGDNRGVSVDSRVLGPVRAGDLIGKVFCRFYPFSQIKSY